MALLADRHPPRLAPLARGARVRPQEATVAGLIEIVRVVRLVPRLRGSAETTLDRCVRRVAAIENRQAIVDERRVGGVQALNGMVMDHPRR